MEYIAKSRHIRQAPRKMRQVVDVIRGKNVQQAIKMLNYTNKKAAVFILKTINSAVSNLLSKEDSINMDQLIIKSIVVERSNSPLRNAWLNCLDKGWKVFESSISSLQYVVENEMDKFPRGIFKNDVSEIDGNLYLHL